MKEDRAGQAHYQGAMGRVQWAIFAPYVLYLASAGLLAVVISIPKGFEQQQPRILAFGFMLGMAIVGTISFVLVRWSGYGSPSVFKHFESSRLGQSLVLVSLAAWTYLVLVVARTNYDGSVYKAMALGLIKDHVLEQPTNLGLHFGPVYPIYLSSFYLLSQDDLATRAAILGMGIIAIAVIFRTTSGLYGPGRAWVTVASTLAVPGVLAYAASNGGEFMAATLYTLTIYFLYLSTEGGKARLMIPAGFFAGMLFLTKSSSGYFFLIAGVGGFLWRFRHRRWLAFKDVNYWIAVGIFLGMVGAWVLPNLLANSKSLGGLGDLATRWSGDLWFAAAYQYSMGQVMITLLHILLFGALMVPFLLAYAWPFLPEVRLALANRRDERVGLLLLAVAGPLVIGDLVSSVYYVFQYYQRDLLFPNPPSEISYFMAHTVRYIFISLIPLTWLFFECRVRFGASQTHQAAALASSPTATKALNTPQPNPIPTGVSGEGGAGG